MCEGRGWMSAADERIADVRFKALAALEHSLTKGEVDAGMAATSAEFLAAGGKLYLHAAE
jgi:hypothetical protein